MNTDAIDPGRAGNGPPMLSGTVLGYTVFRVTMGVNFLFHGLVRFGKNFRPFTQAVGEGFENTFFPAAAARALAATFPAMEFVIGLLLIAGLFTRCSAVAGGLLITLFVAGKCVQQDWQVVGLQMIYAVAFYLLLAGLQGNRLSMDAWWDHRRRST